MISRIFKSSNFSFYILEPEERGQPPLFTWFLFISFSEQVLALCLKNNEEEKIIFLRVEKRSSKWLISLASFTEEKTGGISKSTAGPGRRPVNLGLTVLWASCMDPVHTQSPELERPRWGSKVWQVYPAETGPWPKLMKCLPLNNMTTRSI